MIKKIVLLVATVALPVAAQVSTIAEVRSRVNSDYAPTNTTELLTVEGIVTTHTNLTTVGNTLFYIQDNTAGIPVFVSGLPSSAPPAGARVRVTGPLGIFNGLLELNMLASDTNHVILTLSSNNPLPAPIVFNDFSRADDAPYMKGVVESALVVVSNVFLDLSSGPNFPATTAGGNVNITNESGQIFTLRIDGRVDLRGQVKPTVPVTIVGVMAIFDNSPPHTSSFQLLPSRAADMSGFAKAPVVFPTNVLSSQIRPGDAPVNSFAEQVLRTGEQLTLTVGSLDPDGGPVTVTPIETNLPPGASWTLTGNPGTNVLATISVTGAVALAGLQFDLVLQVSKTNATNIFRETVYVPTIAEQQIIISEFLANPANTPPYENPLNRPIPSANPFTDDEFIEVVNLGSSDVDLIGWTIADDAALRHTFFDFFPVASSNAVIIYGGPLTQNFPNLPVSSAPLNPGGGNLSVFNNGGDSIILRNFTSNLVARVVYAASAPSNGVSLTRWPTLTNNFVAHTSVIATNVSPGTQYDGLPYNVPPAPTNAPPSISDISDRVTPLNTPAGPIPFTIGDAETAPADLVLSKSSSNQEVVADFDIVFGGAGSDRTVTVTPADGISGTSTITITVTDERGRSTSDSFVLTVLAPENPPSISNISDQQASAGTATPTIPFVVFDFETPAGNLTVSGASSDQLFVPDASIVFGGSGSNRTVTVTPAGTASGPVTITVFVSDGSLTNSDSFVLNIYPAVLLGDDFSYADGSITTNSAFFWNAHSGQTGQTQVISGHLGISGSQSEDINAPLTNGPFAAPSGLTLYAGFTVNFTQLPNAAGGYFAHFKDAANGFRGRIYSGTANAAAGTFRLGIANAAGTVSTQAVPDLQLSNTYALVLRYNVATAESTLWINPATETDPGVTALDTAATISVASWAFRQSGGIGNMEVDQLKVGTSFAAVLPRLEQGVSLRIGRSGTDFQISWPASSPGTLQSTPSLTQTDWQPVTETAVTNGSQKVITITNPTGNRFFRLAQ